MIIIFVFIPFLENQKSIENDGLAAFVIHDNWKNPQEIKDILQNMYQDKKQPLEGAVFIGDIPIPMIREAQPLTSALKIPEKIKWENSSVASDRFYDDFDLKFDYLKQDSVASRNLYHYYKLAAKSPHYIEMDIYTGRIKPPVNPDSESAIDQIKSYLNKIVQLKAESNTLDKMIVSTGHGYNSNSTVSWGNELLAMRSTFPKLFAQGSSIKFLNYRNSSFLKNALLTELQREDLDLAFMTGHGTVTLQLMNGYPDVSSPQPSMENVGRYIRSKMRNAKDSNRDLDKVKSDFQNSLGLNDKWFEDAFDEALKAARIQVADLTQRLAESVVERGERDREIGQLRAAVIALEKHRETARQQSDEQGKKHAEERIRLEERASASERRMLTELDRERQETKRAKASLDEVQRAADASKGKFFLATQSLTDKLNESNAELALARQALSVSEERSAELLALSASQRSIPASERKQPNLRRATPERKKTALSLTRRRRP